MNTRAFSDCLRQMDGDRRTHFISLEAAEGCRLGDISSMPRSLKVLSEDILYRLEPDAARREIAALSARDSSVPVSFAPGRALLQDFMGIPLMTDMASMRDRLHEEGLAPDLLNPLIPVDFVVDHSLTVMHAGSAGAFEANRQFEMERNLERFHFIKWCQSNFSNFRVIPPGRGIMHQVNLEWLSSVVRLVVMPDGPPLARPDTMIGTDSHTTMVNALGVLGWGVGGLEAEMAMLGIPISMAAPRVVGMQLEGRLRPGVTATDLVLHMTERLRGLGVVGAFVEFFGQGVGALPLADRATIANMSPEFGATCCYFPIDGLTIDYLAMTGRTPDHLATVEAYAKAQGLWQCGRESGKHLRFDETHVFDLETVEPSMAGPVRPDQRVALSQVPGSFSKRLQQLTSADSVPALADRLGHGSVVLAAITSCTNTSNPRVMMTAGLLARNAAEKGLTPKPWVKTSMSPGSRVVTDYLTAAGLTPHLDQLGFQNVGYGCATCNGNSGPLAEPVSSAIQDESLCTVAVLSGNRNFEGRIHPQVKAAYLASPPLVIAAAITGSVATDLERDALGLDRSGKPVFLRDIWPADSEVTDYVTRYVRGDMFRASYASGMETTSSWAALEIAEGELFDWDHASTFIRPSPFTRAARKISGALSQCRPLLVLGDAVTTDHISPNGAIGPLSPAGQFLLGQGVDQRHLGNFGTRRGNPDVCLRGMFDNPLLVNELVAGRRGNFTEWRGDGAHEILSVYEAAMRYQADAVATVIVAGRNYGAGSSRDWAAKGLCLLGVTAVLVESFERIHRTNLVGMGILPLTLPDNIDHRQLEVSPEDTFDIDLPNGLQPLAPVKVDIFRDGCVRMSFDAVLQINSQIEAEMIEAGGMLPSILERIGLPPGK